MNEKENDNNPFIYSTPVRGPIFFGRHDLLRKIFYYINAGESVSLVGERRTGKTSILRRVLDLKEQRLRQPTQHLLVFQDFLGIEYRTQSDIWVVILTSLSEEMASAGLETKCVLGAIEQLQSGGLIYSTLFKVFATLRNNGYRVTFLFDEFEATANEKNPIDLSFYRLLRNFAIDDYTKVNYLIATRQPLSDVERFVERKFSARSSHFYNIFTQLLIQPFSSDEAALMVNSLLKSTTLSFRTRLSFWLQRDFLFQLSGFHPFFLQRACYRLFEHGVLSDGSFTNQVPKEEIVNAFLKDSVAHFQYYWEISLSYEQQVMRKLAAGQAIEWQPVMSVQRTLEHRCLIVQSDSGWRLFSSVFEKWINEMAPKESDQPPVRSADAYDFVNRHQDLSKLLVLLESHLYVHLYGPSGIGKTDLVAQLLQTRYAEHHTAYLDLNDSKFRAQSKNPERLLREIGRQYYNSLLYRALSLPELISNLSYKINQTGQSGVIVLDHIERMTPEMMRQLRKEILPALQDKITDPALYLRVIAISQNEIEEWRGLAGLANISFQPYALDALPSVLHDLDTYQALLRQAVARWGKQPLDPHDAESNKLLKRWANELYNLTGGHLGAIEATLNYVGRNTQFATPDVFEAQHQVICEQILTPLVSQAVQTSLPTREYQQAFQQLWVFRYLSKGVLKRLLREVKDKPHWHDLNGITRHDNAAVASLWEQLTETALLRSNALSRHQLLSHQLTPIWRRMGNQILQSNPTVYRTLHQDARAVFEHFTDQKRYEINLRITCFVEVLYHLTQEATIAPSEHARHHFTQDLLARLNQFLSSLRGDQRFDHYLEKLNDLLDQELRDVLERLEELDSWRELKRMISTSESTKSVKPQPIRGREAIYALERGG